MGKTREGEQVYIHPSTFSTRYGDLIQGLDPDKKVKFITVDTTGALNTSDGFNISKYDYVALTYVAAGNGAGEIETVTYKTGGVGGTTIATLTLAYNGDNEISSITKS